MATFISSVAVIAFMLINLLSVTCGDGVNILAFYPFPYLSHHRSYWPLLRELAKRGHNVTMVSPFNMENPPKNYKEITIPDFTNKDTKGGSLTNFFVVERPIINQWMGMGFLRDMSLQVTEKILQDHQVQWLLNSDSKFDVIIGEFSFCEEAFAALIHRFDAHYIEFKSFGNFHWTHWLYGNPYDTSYIADSSTTYSDRMTFIERVENTVFSVALRFHWYNFIVPKHQRLADAYIHYEGWQARPPLIDLLQKVSLVLINTHYSLSYPYPLAPNFKDVGGINLNCDIKPLPKDIKDFMDGAEEGVIYFSMGSYIQASSSIETAVLNHFIRAFSKLKQRVLWKFESDMPNLPANVKIGKWLPQPAILAHPNCKLFISHSGFLSTSETIEKGIPVVSVPIFGDQPSNAKVVTTKGMAVTLDYRNLTEDTILWGIKEVLQNPKYKEKAVQQSKIYKDTPETALETAVYWIEYVIRHKGAHHLRPAIATMPWYQQAMIDVYLALAAIVLLPTYLAYKLLYCTLKCTYRILTHKSKKKND